MIKPFLVASTVARFEAAVRAHEMSGAQPPEDREAIAKEYEEAKAAITRLINHYKISAHSSYGRLGK